MITAGLIIFGALLFVLGVITGSMTKSTACACKYSYKERTLLSDKELKNFLSYDGTEQE